MIHFAEALFNPGFGRIPDLNDFLPYDKQWFLDGLNEVDFRTTDKCVKNEANAYRPSWLPAGSTIRDEIVKFVAKRIPEQNVAQPADPNNQQEPLDDSFDDDLGPNFGSMNQLPDANDLVGGNTREERALAAIVKYESHHKGYVPSFSFELCSMIDEE